MDSQKLPWQNLKQLFTIISRSDFCCCFNFSLVTTSTSTGCFILPRDSPLDASKCEATAEAFGFESTCGSRPGIKTNCCLGSQRRNTRRARRRFKKWSMDSLKRWGWVSVDTYFLLMTFVFFPTQHKNREDGWYFSFLINVFFVLNLGGSTTLFVARLIRTTQSKPFGAWDDSDSFSERVHLIMLWAVNFDRKL